MRYVATALLVLGIILICHGVHAGSSLLPMLSGGLAIGISRGIDS